MELSNLTGFPCQDVFQFTISGHRRRTVNRPIGFREGADSTDVTVTLSVLTSNECQSLFDRTNSVETNDICSLCKVSNNRKSLCSICGLFFHFTCVRLGKAESNGLRSWFCQRCLSPVSSQLPNPPNTQNQHNLRLTLNCLHCQKKEDIKNSLEDSQRGSNNSSGSLGRHHRRALVGYDQSWSESPALPRRPCLPPHRQTLRAASH